MPQGLAIFSGRASLALASKVCLYVGVQPGCIEVSNFSDGEIYVQIKENVRGRRCFRDPVDLPAREREPHGIADHDRRPEAFFGTADYRGDPILRLRAPG